MKIDILVDGAEFWERLSLDIARSRHSVLTQTYSFEGDEAGWGLARALLGSRANVRHVLVDAFTKHRVNDKFLYHPKHFLDRKLWHEVRDSRRMYRELTRQGVHLRFSSPVGCLFRRLPFRNHKKLVTIDGRVVYVGGINFTDHNFEWHDLMLRIESTEVAMFLEQDFRWSWEGRNQATARRFDGLELHVLGGFLNERQFDLVLGLVEGANDEIFVESPYLAPPFSDALHRASARGVHVVIVTPETNNWRLCREHIEWKAATSNLELRLYPRMTHMKAMLIDGRHLIVGSTNFELWSYRFQQEFLCIVTAPAVIEQFVQKVMLPDIDASRPLDPQISPMRGRAADLRLSWLEKLARGLDAVRVRTREQSRG